MRIIIWRHLFIFLYISLNVSTNPTKKNDYDYLNKILGEEGQDPDEEYYYDYYEEPFDSTKYKQEIYLDQKLKVECEPTLNIDQMEFKFKEILFNESLHDISTTILPKFVADIDYSLYDNRYTLIKTSQVYKNILATLLSKKIIKKSIYEVTNSKYRDSGHYYCVYTSSNDNYLIKNYWFIVHDEKSLRKSFDDHVILEPCLDSDEYSLMSNNSTKFNNQTKIVWTLSDTLGTKFWTQKLKIHLNDLMLFDMVYLCQNSKTGAYKKYTIECINRHELNTDPIVTPINQTVTSGTTTIYTCESTAKNRPASYQWFLHKSNLEPNLPFNLDLKNSLGSGSILKLSNITVNQSGLVMCCAMYSRYNMRDRFEQHRDNNFMVKAIALEDFISACSYAELNVIERIVTNEGLNNSENLTNAFKLIFLICALLIISLIIFVICAYKRYNVYLETVQAAKTMHTNDFYQSASDDINLTDEEKRFKQILTSSSSIELLLDKKTIEKWRIPINDLTFGEEIGRGAFGIVLYADLKRKLVDSNSNQSSNYDSGMESITYSSIVDNEESRYLLNGTQSIKNSKEMRQLSVAAKKLPTDANLKDYIDQFKELELMSNVGQHPNIINLIGYSIQETSLLIITDYAKFGNLKDYMRKLHEENDSEKLLTVDKQVLYSYQIALGMKYLHSKKVLHRDLAARNILVDENDLIKIADFGLARNMRTDYYYVQQKEGKMPLKWMSPEALCFNRISNESDIWSYGILMWEIWSHGQTPYPTVPIENLLTVLKSGYRMEKPLSCPEIIYKLIHSCWEYKPKKRPSFQSVVVFFENNLKLKEIGKIIKEIDIHDLATSKINLLTKNFSLDLETKTISTSLSSLDPSTSSSSTNNTGSNSIAQTPDPYKDNKLVAKINDDLDNVKKMSEDTSNKVRLAYRRDSSERKLSIVSLKKTDEEQRPIFKYSLV